MRSLAIVTSSLCIQDIQAFVKRPEMTWLVEFSEMNAIFCNQTWTFIGGRINQEVIKNTNRYKVIKLCAFRQR